MLHWKKKKKETTNNCPLIQTPAALTAGNCFGEI